MNDDSQESTDAAVSVATVFGDLVDVLDAQGALIVFRPGHTAEHVRAVMRSVGIDQPRPELVEWFCLQDGLDRSDDRLFFDFVPASLEELADDREDVRTIYDEMAADLPEVRDLDVWPQPSWFPLSVGEGRFVVDNAACDGEACVYRHWSDQLEDYGNSVVEFLAEGLRAQRRGTVRTTAASRDGADHVLHLWQRDAEVGDSEG